MSELVIGAFNLAEAKTGGLNSTATQQEVISRQWDVAVFPEALPEGGLQAQTRRVLENAGYKLYCMDYNDDDGRKDRHALAVIAKPELVVAARALRTAGRNSIALRLGGEIDFAGVHFDDRTEVRRRKQAEGLVAYLGESAIIAGDQNSMHAADTWAKRLRGTRGMADALPSKNPGEKQNKLQRLGSLSQRLAQMADGGTQEFLAQHGFVDADPNHASTMKLGPIGVQLDRIIYRGDVVVAEPTQVYHAEGLSDHAMIQATLRTA